MFCHRKNNFSGYPQNMCGPLKYIFLEWNRKMLCKYILGTRNIETGRKIYILFLTRKKYILTPKTHLSGARKFKENIFKAFCVYELGIIGIIVKCTDHRNSYLIR